MSNEKQTPDPHRSTDYLKELFANPRDLWSIPNLLVYFRVLLSILFLVIYVIGVNKNEQGLSWGVYPHRDDLGVQVDGFLAATLILTCGFTDFLDGFIARKFNQKTNLGQFLDPFADKLLQLFIAVGIGLRYGLDHQVIEAAVGQLKDEPGIWVVWLLLALLIVKEAFMFFANWFVFVKKGAKLNRAEWYGKLSTLVLYLTTGIMLFFVNMLDSKTIFVIILCWICSLALAFSFIMYVPKYVDMYRSPEKYRVKNTDDSGGVA